MGEQRWSTPDAPRAGSVVDEARAVAVYGLIHGAYHGAWCWDFLAPELDLRGHRAIAVDLPTENPTAGVSRYADLVIEALAGVEEDVVLVAHSLGGLVAPVVAVHRPVRQIFYIAGVLPEPGRSLAHQQLEHPDMVFQADKIDNGDGTWSWPADDAGRAFYHDCAAERRRYAVARLRRQSRAPHEEPSPLTGLPDVPSTYVVCADDHALRPRWQRETARTRLGVEPLELPGSHCPFLARPEELADVLIGGIGSG
jgi:pimeloyl-ACP methyl ester carboxylesterase